MQCHFSSFQKRWWVLKGRNASATWDGLLLTLQTLAFLISLYSFNVKEDLDLAFEICCDCTTTFKAGIFESPVKILSSDRTNLSSWSESIISCQSKWLNFRLWLRFWRYFFKTAVDEVISSIIISSESIQQLNFHIMVNKSWIQFD